MEKEEREAALRFICNLEIEKKLNCSSVIAKENLNDFLNNLLKKSGIEKEEFLVLQDLIHDTIEKTKEDFFHFGSLGEDAYNL